jgi:hypothetical protein
VQMKHFIILLILLIFASPTFGSTVYKWIDKEGVVNFTDDIENVPPAYRGRVEVIKEEVEKEVNVPSRQAALPKQEETKTDIYGRGESWWRDRVRPWKDRLKETDANFERAHKNFMEKAEELSTRRFGSPTQYKTNIIELDRTKEEMLKYGDQVAEVKEMLEKLSKEAEESKASPDWLK